MGICANPLAHRVGISNGIKLYVPECLSANSVSTLTEKVGVVMLWLMLSNILFKLCTSTLIKSGQPPSFLGSKIINSFEWSSFSFRYLHVFDHRDVT